MNAFTVFDGIMHQSQPSKDHTLKLIASDALNE